MDETRIKRLLITLAVSIVIILLLKMMLLKMATKVSTAANKAAAEKLHAAASSPDAGQPVALPAAAAASGVN